MELSAEPARSVGRRRAGRAGAPRARVEITERDLSAERPQPRRGRVQAAAVGARRGQRSCFAGFLLPALALRRAPPDRLLGIVPELQADHELRGARPDDRVRHAHATERVHWTAPARSRRTSGTSSRRARSGPSTRRAAGRRLVRRQAGGDRGAGANAVGFPNFVHIGILRDAPAAPEVMFLDDALEDACLHAVNLRSPLPLWERVRVRVRSLFPLGGAEVRVQSPLPLGEG